MKLKLFLLLLGLMSFPSWSVPLKIELVKIPKGTYQIGCDIFVDKRCDLSDGEDRPLKVVNSKEFKISKYEITQGQYNKCIKGKFCTLPKKGFTPKKNPKKPITSVTWSQARAFCKWLKLDLPNENEWEIAARSGDTRIYSWGNNPPNCETSNFSYLCKSDLKDVGSFPRDMSSFGLYDVVGNVEEWTLDMFSNKYPVHLKVVRGGSYRSDEWHSRLSHRTHAKEDSAAPERGFRCASAD